MLERLEIAEGQLHETEYCIDGSWKKLNNTSIRQNTSHDV